MKRTGQFTDSSGANSVDSVHGVSSFPPRLTPPDWADHVVLDGVSECPLNSPDTDSDQRATNAI